jgi:GR25 family glycosyltransferase involved in LPS biosynthesis
MNYKEIPAFCINLDRRPDRWKQVQKEFEKIGWLAKRWSAKQYEKSPYDSMEAGAAGVLDSHREIWRRALDSNLEIVAIFEDDVIFSGDFTEVYSEAVKELPSDWLCWHLHTSGIRQSNESKPIGRYINSLATHGWGAHGYILKRPCLETLVSYKTIVQQRVDTILTLGLKSAGVQPYGTIPKYTLCFQSGEDSDIAETSQLGYWKKQISYLYR